MKSMKKTAVWAGVVAVITGASVLFMDKVVMPWYTRHGEEVIVPDVEQMAYDEAVATLAKAGLSARKTYNVRYIRDVDSTTVIVQRPAAGSAVKPGRRVALVVNKQEKPLFSVPDFYGKPLDEVRRTLQRFDMTLTEVQEQAVYDVGEDGRVLGQSVPPSTQVTYGASISLVVGRIQDQQQVAQVSVPNVLGLLLDDAREEILGAGLNTGNVMYEYSSLLVPNTVINQKPAANTLTDPGRVVELTIVIPPD